MLVSTTERRLLIGSAWPQRVQGAVTKWGLAVRELTEAERVRVEGERASVVVVFWGFVGGSRAATAGAAIAAVVTVVVVCEVVMARMGGGLSGSRIKGVVD